MIQPHEVMPLLLQACPSFAPLWEAHVREYGDDSPYGVAWDFSLYLLARMQMNDHAELAAAGVMIERLHVDGVPWVREFATVGILEDVQNAWSRAGVDPASILPWLGPESAKWWHALNAFWSGQAPCVQLDAG